MSFPYCAKKRLNIKTTFTEMITLYNKIIIYKSRYTFIVFPVGQLEAKNRLQGYTPNKINKNIFLNLKLNLKAH